jgi:hypothetical protein
MMDWLKATAAAFTAVTAWVALFIAFIYRCGGHLEPRGPDDIQDYLSPDGNYVATVKTESGGHLVGWYCLSVLVHPATVATQEALKAGKRYLVLGGDCDGENQVGISQSGGDRDRRGKLPGQLRDRTQRFVTTDLNRF